MNISPTNWKAAADERMIWGGIIRGTITALESVRKQQQETKRTERKTRSAANLRHNAPFYVNDGFLERVSLSKFTLEPFKFSEGELLRM